MFLIIISNVTVLSQTSLNIVRIAPQDKLVIIKDGENLNVLKVGDKVNSYGVIEDISENRIVFKKTENNVVEKIIIHFENGIQKKQRISSKSQEQNTHIIPDTNKN